MIKLRAYLINFYKYYIGLWGIIIIMCFICFCAITITIYLYSHNKISLYITISGHIISISPFILQVYHDYTKKKLENSLKIVREIHEL
jgi:hypothetical protein